MGKSDRGLPRNSTPSVRPYSALAPLYDQIMAHVDYDRWAAYLVSLCRRFGKPPRRTLELGCGTGNLTFPLSSELGGSYLATDYSDEMLEVARKKPESVGKNVQFETADFRCLQMNGVFDLIVLAYDGVNYLVEQEEVIRLLEGVAWRLDRGGIFLFDQTTPANSINNLAYFDDRWESDDASYVRSSHYDVDRHLHTTRFDVRIGGKRAHEVHFQRAYDLAEMELMLKLSSFRVDGCLDAFSLAPATDQSERIQWVLSMPNLPTNTATG
ncbi:MAG TPA: class I SAM-dependent methyltransferase [Rhodothermales bacterium]|nr:class I SAM-dependent methyltransferase [Rhodothermales bacterium]